MSISSAVLSGGNITITGSGFGTKTNALPYLFADFAADINPHATLSRITSWAQNQNMSWNASGINSKGCARGVGGTGLYTLRVDASGYAINTLSQKNYWFRKHWHNFETMPGNWKIARCWPAAFGQPDLYIATGTAIKRAFVEGPDGGPWFNPEVNEPDDEWFWDEIIEQANSGLATTDGILRYRRNNVQYASEGVDGDWITRNASHDVNMVLNYVVHGEQENEPSWPAGNEYKVGYVYYDNSWSRAMIGNASTWAACTDAYPLPASAWSNTSITAAQKAPIASISGWYAYVWNDGVIDSNNGTAITETVSGAPKSASFVNVGRLMNR